MTVIDSPTQSADILLVFWAQIKHVIRQISMKGFTFGLTLELFFGIRRRNSFAFLCFRIGVYL